MPELTLTADMPIRPLSELELRIRRGEKLVVVRSLPLSMFVEGHERQCQANHEQTLERIRERHGFSACETVAVLTCLPYESILPMSDELAHRILYAMLATHNRGMRVAEGKINETSS